MNIKTLITEYITVFALTLVTIASVTFLWNIIEYGKSTIDWETSFRFAVIFGIILTWKKSREIKENRVFKNLKQ
jgi:hypothetical protein